jgi:4-amino-4-deoxy-L-arabinose transferase-like glycosyltransferase
MFLRVKSKIRRFAHAGVGRGNRFVDRQILLANYVYIISVIIIALYILTYSIIDFFEFLPIIIFDTFVIISILFSLFLNHNHNFRASKMFFLVTAHIFLPFLVLYFGTGTGFHYYFFIFISFILLTYDRESKFEKKFAIMWVIISMVLFGVFDNNLIKFEPLINIPETMMELLHTSSQYGSFAFFVIIIELFMRRYKRRYDLDSKK